MRSNFRARDRERAERRQEEKLKQATPSNEASTRVDPQAVATKRTIKSSDSATVVGLTWPPKTLRRSRRSIT